MKKSAKATALALVVATSIGAQACYGKFALTKIVYDFNGSITSNRFVHTIIMYGLNIIPVYGIAVVADLYVFNLVEAFTGSNLLDGASAPKVSVNTLEDGSVEYTTDAGTFRMVQIDDRTADVYKDGAVIGSAVMAETGELLVNDAQGKTLHVFSSDEVAEMAARQS